MYTVENEWIIFSWFQRPSKPGANCRIDNNTNRVTSEERSFKLVMGTRNKMKSHTLSDPKSTAMERNPVRNGQNFKNWCHAGDSPKWLDLTTCAVYRICLDSTRKDILKAPHTPLLSTSTAEIDAANRLFTLRWCHRLMNRVQFVLWSYWDNSIRNIWQHVFKTRSRLGL